jgi:hypothetical protein
MDTWCLGAAQRSEEILDQIQPGWGLVMME